MEKTKNRMLMCKLTEEDRVKLSNEQSNHYKDSLELIAGGVMIYFFVPGKPIAQGRPRFAKRGKFVTTYDPATSRDYKSWVRSCALDHMAEMSIPMFPRGVPLRMVLTVGLEKPKSVKKTVSLPVTKPDLDNFTKGICDALESICYAADQQIVCMSLRKVYDTRPGALVVIQEYEE
jgi:Holliday junction resolvase RusA-like endonuclease